MIQLQQTDTFGNWGKVAIARSFSQVVKYESKVLKEGDSGVVHQLCVALENLRSAIVLFIPALNFPVTVSEKKISKITKALSKLSEIDSLEETLITKYQPYLPANAQKKLKTVRKYIKQKRKSALKKVRKLLKSHAYLQLKQDLESWLENPTYNNLGAIAIEEMLPDLLSIQISKLLMHPGWLVGTSIIAGEIHLRKNFEPLIVEKIITIEAKTLNDLRQEIKKVHTSLVFFPQFYSNIYQEYLQKISDVKKSLFSIQITLFLNKILTKSLGGKKSKKLSELTNIMQEIRYKNWQEWTQLQSIFCDYQKRQEFRSILQYPRIK